MEDLITANNSIHKSKYLLGKSSDFTLEFKQEAVTQQTPNIARKQLPQIFYSINIKH